MATLPASGAQHTLRAGGYRADIATIGASVRCLQHEGRDIIVPFDANEVRPAMRGALLAPWPNRIADGRYVFAGTQHQLPINEIATRTASHGLVAWQNFTVADEQADSLVLTATIEPQPGYPWRIRVDVVFGLTADGLRQEVSATNLSDDAAPFGVGAHPYLLAGPADREAVDTWRLQIPAERVLLVSADRMLPMERFDVIDHEAGRYDFRTARPLGSAALNNAYTGLARDERGMACVRVMHDGVGVEAVWDEGTPWVQIYTADESAGGDFRHGIAGEPRTCPPDAFNSGTDRAVIEAGATFTAGWAIRAV